MKLKLDVINKWQEPPEEVETVKFWVLPDDGLVKLGATLPDGKDVCIGYFCMDSDTNKIEISMSVYLPKNYFKLDDREFLYTF